MWSETAQNGALFAIRINENTHGECGRRQLGRYSDSLGLDGPEIESRWERDFSPPFRAALFST